MLGKVTGMIRGMEHISNRSLWLKLLFLDSINGKEDRFLLILQISNTMVIRQGRGFVFVGHHGYSLYS